MVGRSNVGKSSLINALVRQKVARTSAAPGKTRLANIYLVARGSSRPFYLVDLPGYGYARGGASSAREFEELAQAYFAPASQAAMGEHPASRRGASDRPDPAVLLLVDARHPGLESDVDAWAWMRHAVGRSAVVATKIDKLSRGERSRALRDLQSVFDDPILPVSAATGEGLDELWKLIDKLTNRNQMARNRSSGPAPPPLPKRPPRLSEPTTSRRTSPKK